MFVNVNRRQFCQGALALTSACCLRSAQAAPQHDVPWLAEVQQLPAILPENAPRLPPLLVDAQARPITTQDAWQVRRSELREQWRHILGSLGLDEHRRPELEVMSEDREAGVLRQLVRYEIEPGMMTEAYLIRPLEGGDKLPAVAVFHSTVDHSILQPAGLGSDPQKAFGLKLAKRGMVTFSPRNFLWPDNRRIAANQEAEKFLKRHPRATGMAKMLDDARVAVNILERLPGVDPGRIGAVGHSLGAKEVLYLAAFDDRIRATVSSEGGIGTKFSNWEAPWYLGQMLKQPDFQHEHHELLAMVAPRAFLLIGGDSADGDRCWPFITAAMPVYRLFTERPRVGLYNHKKGHAVPPESERRIEEWLATYL